MGFIKRFVEYLGPQSKEFKLRDDKYFTERGYVESFYKEMDAFL